MVVGSVSGCKRRSRDVVHGPSFDGIIGELLGAKVVAGSILRGLHRPTADDVQVVLLRPGVVVSGRGFYMVFVRAISHPCRGGLITVARAPRTMYAGGCENFAVSIVENPGAQNFHIKAFRYSIVGECRCLYADLLVAVGTLLHDGDGRCRRTGVDVTCIGLGSSV